MQIQINQKLDDDTTTIDYITGSGMTTHCFRFCSKNSNAKIVEDNIRATPVRMMSNRILYLCTCAMYQSIDL
jgi:hypothetical protein